MCKVFPSSLEPVAMRWFDGLEAGFIDLKKKKKKTHLGVWILLYYMQ